MSFQDIHRIIGKIKKIIDERVYLSIEFYELLNELIKSDIHNIENNEVFYISKTETDDDKVYYILMNEYTKYKTRLLFVDDIFVRSFFLKERFLNMFKKTHFYDFVKEIIELFSKIGNLLYEIDMLFAEINFKTNFRLNIVGENGFSVAEVLIFDKTIKNEIEKRINELDITLKELHRKLLITEL